jgi:hypothetical protein
MDLGNKGATAREIKPEIARTLRQKLIPLVARPLHGKNGACRLNSLRHFFPLARMMPPVP